MRNSKPIMVFYDGACGVCNTEMNYYRKIADGQVSFIDISADSFAAEEFGKTSEDFQRSLHVCDNDGRFFVGVDAFRKLWDNLPSPFYPLLSTFVGIPGVNLVSHCGYTLFARFRHLLPARSQSTCSIDKPGKH